LLGAGKKDKARRVFKLNAEEHPDERFWTYLGLAQIYTATEEKGRAIENWEKALQSVPDGNRSEIPDHKRPCVNFEKAANGERQEKKPRPDRSRERGGASGLRRVEVYFLAMAAAAVGAGRLKA